MDAPVANKCSQFIDLCILLGCDYVDPIKGVGPTTALKLIRDHKNLEGVVEHMKNNSKFTIPEDWPYKEARILFQEPDVLHADHEDCEFKWEKPDTEGLVNFLVKEKNFNEDRVRNGAARLEKALKSQQQSRLEGFFKAVPKTAEEQAALKRKNEAKVEERKKKQKLVAKEKKEAKSKPRGAGG